MSSKHFQASLSSGRSACSGGEYALLLIQPCRSWQEFVPEPVQGEQAQGDTAEILFSPGRSQDIPGFWDENTWVKGCIKKGSAKSIVTPCRMNGLLPLIFKRQGRMLNATGFQTGPIQPLGQSATFWVRKGDVNTQEQCYVVVHQAAWYSQDRAVNASC